MKAPLSICQTLMIQGTTSDAGKSTLVAGLCRLYARRNKNIAPFKPQNMALNSAVTEDGGEIGRAQAVQAQACGITPTSDMNPVLIKPNSDTGAQVIVQGKAIGNMNAANYHQYKSVVLDKVMESYNRLASEYDVIMVEGAGSPAEINLRDRDIANMGFAEKADCPVILIADIDRGGVFAHIVGTLQLLAQSEQDRVIGFVINKFRGDFSLLEPGLQWLQQKTGKPTLGVLPYLHNLHIEAEDALPRDKNQHTGHGFKIIVPALPRISNHTDFDPLRLHPGVNFQFIDPDEDIPPADLIILPGSKSVRDDLNWLKRKGWDEAIQRHLRYQGKILGICGGFQMLGQEIIDSEGIEGCTGNSNGLGLLDMTTRLQTHKILKNVKGRLTINNTKVTGYEIHAGISEGPSLDRPLIKFADRNDGAVSSDNLVAGTYLHGIFNSKPACDALLSWAGLKKQAAIDYEQLRENQLDRLADELEKYLDIAFIDTALNQLYDLPKKEPAHV